MEHIPFELIREVPPVTRYWLFGVVLVAMLEHYGVVTVRDLVYSYEGVFVKRQYWRLLSSFFYFRRFGFDLILTLYVTLRTSSSLEENIGDTFEYLWVLVVNGLVLCFVSDFIQPFHILGTKLDEVLLYTWARRNSEVRMEILTLVEFSAAYLPFVYALINIFLYHNSAKDIIMTLFCGHLFFFLLDVFPKLHGYRPLAPPFKQQ